MSINSSVNTSAPAAVSPTTTSVHRRAWLIIIAFFVVLIIGSTACSSEPEVQLAQSTDGTQSPAAPAPAAVQAPAAPAPAAVQAEPTPEPTTAPADSSATQSTIDGRHVSPSGILLQAEGAWQARDWNALGAIATTDVVAVAQSGTNPTDVGPLGTLTDDLDQAWQCASEDGACTAGLWSCEAGGQVCSGELLYGYEPDAGCCAAIYRVTLEDQDDGFRVTSLEFAGDAG